MEDMDLTVYLKPTRFSAAGGVVLGMQLITAAPATPSPAVRDALARVREETVALQAVARQRLGGGGPVVRKLDLKLGGAWIGARMRLEGMMRIASGDDADRAEALLQEMLPQGTRFVQGDANEQWTTTANLLERIDERGLAARIDELVGPQLLPTLRATHAALGEALGVGETAVESPDTRAALSQIAQLAKAIANYGRVMVGWVNPDDEESVAIFRRAMTPLDMHRRAFFGASSAEVVEPEPGEDGPELTDPVPPLPEVVT